MRIWLICLLGWGANTLLMPLRGQVDAGINLAGAVLSRAIVLVEFPLDSTGAWSLEVGGYYSQRPELRERGTGRVLLREGNSGVVVDGRRYFRPGRERTGLFAGAWLRYNRFGSDDRRVEPVRTDRRQEFSLGVLAGYKHFSTGRVFIEPSLGVGTVWLNLVAPLGFGGDDVVPLAADYVVRLRAGYRF